MTNLHPDYGRSRHPYVTTWGSALTNRLTYVYLVTVSNLSTRHWLVFVWSVNTGFPLARVIAVIVARGKMSPLDTGLEVSLPFCHDKEWKLKKRSEIKTCLVFPNMPAHTPPPISLLVKSLCLWSCQ